MEKEIDGDLQICAGAWHCMAQQDYIEREIPPGDDYSLDVTFNEVQWSVTTVFRCCAVHFLACEAINEEGTTISLRTVHQHVLNT